MAYKKKLIEESDEESKIRLMFETVSNIGNRSEKTAWKRKQKKLSKIIETKLNPLEDDILNLLKEKQIILDEVEILRLQMVKDCIHPFELLVYDNEDDCVSCKFCNRRLKPLLNSHAKK